MKQLLPSQRLAAYLIRTNNQREMNPATAQIPKQWQDFMQIWPEPPGQVYAVYTDYQSDHTGEYTFGLGFVLQPKQDIPKGMSELILPTADYLVYPATSTKTEDIVATWQQVWHDFDPQHLKHAPLRRSYTTDYERYESLTQVSVCIAVE